MSDFVQEFGALTAGSHYTSRLGRLHRRLVLLVGPIAAIDVSTDRLLISFLEQPRTLSVTHDRLDPLLAMDDADFTADVARTLCRTSSTS